MKRLLTSAKFYTKPNKETMKLYFQELELSHREGLVSFSDMEYLKAAALKYLKDYKSES